jgi:hypothetical protein
MVIDVSMGSDSMVLMRLASAAIRAALALASASASTIPSAIFWFGQITPQTFRNMMIASHTPTPIRVKPMSPGE